MKLHHCPENVQNDVAHHTLKMSKVCAPVYVQVVNVTPRYARMKAADNREVSALLREEGPCKPEPP